ncbi:hypothetical protein D9758_009073 [Tetrapyrgos nigripes]|uniref:Endo-chitosanase n=1 Tax=Tetrapyrgos nigripes TaxID=182062 RepID=A0A8H5GAC7_9AGAR|nr:hypothetical protein D9758_009073 [Tetrapyrgos nigripes]
MMMKASFVFLAIAMAASVSAAPAQDLPTVHPMNSTIAKRAAAFQAASDIDVAQILAAVKAATKDPLAQFLSDAEGGQKVTIFGDFMVNNPKAMSFIADMDVDCDGSATCGSSTDQSATAFGDLNAMKVPFYVIPETFLGKEDSGFVEPNSLGAIICGGKMFYAIMGDTNGSNPQVIGEGSILLAQTCFPNDNIGPDNGHDPLDVAYIVFGDKVPSGVGEETIDIQALKTLGDTTLRAFQESLSSGQSQTQCARSYTVRSGDLCDAISAAQHASTFQLANANQGVINADCSNLAVGMPLCLGDLGKDCSTVTVVKSGDECATIANKAGIPLATLLHNNPNVDADCSNIYPGEVLCTSGQLFNY